MSEAFWTAFLVAALTSVVPPVIVWLLQRRRSNVDAVATYATATSTGAKTIADLFDEIGGLRAELVQERASRRSEVAELADRIDKKQTRITHLEEREAHTEHEISVLRSENRTLRATMKSWVADAVTAWNVVSEQMSEAGMTPRATFPPVLDLDK